MEATCSSKSRWHSVNYTALQDRTLQLRWQSSRIKRTLETTAHTMGMCITNTEKGFDFRWRGEIRVGTLSTPSYNDGLQNFKQMNGARYLTDCTRYDTTATHRGTNWKYSGARDQEPLRLGVLRVSLQVNLVLNFYLIVLPQLPRFMCNGRMTVNDWRILRVILKI
jgi:hypothetical protein